MERYKVVKYDGEHCSVFYIIDTAAPADEQPAIVTARTRRDEADQACREWNSETRLTLSFEIQSQNGSIEP